MPFCRYNSGILCHAELQVAINHAAQIYLLIFDSIISNLSKWVEMGDNVHLADKTMA